MVRASREKGGGEREGQGRTGEERGGQGRTGKDRGGQGRIGEEREYRVLHSPCNRAIRVTI